VFFEPAGKKAGRSDVPGSGAAHAGYRSQSPETTLHKRVVDIGFSALMIALALVFLFRFPITTKDVANVRSALQ
jgi:hypothetical protein